MIALVLAACAAPEGDADTDVPACTDGIEVGECAPDVTVVDRDGASADLLGLRGRVTLYASEAMWCESCRQLVAGLDDLYVAREPDGFLAVDVLIEDVDGNPPDGVDAGQWADVLGLHYPVVADSNGAFFATYGEGANWFVFYVVDADGRITWRATSETPSTVGDVTAAVDEALGR